MIMQTIIRRRFFLIYYPVLLILTSWFSLVFASLNWYPALGFLRLLSETQFTLVFIITALYLLQHEKPVIKFLTILFAIVVAVFVWNGCLKSMNGFSMVPFMGPSATFFILSKIGIGFVITGIFLVSEQAIILEKKRRRDRLKKLANERKVTENNLKYLQARVEPQFLLDTLTSIAGLREDDPDRAKHLQLKLIEYLQESLIRTKIDSTLLKQEIECITRGAHD